MTKWEYKLENYDELDASEMIKLNKLGKDGWELVNVSRIRVALDEMDAYYKMIFKRPVK